MSGGNKGFKNCFFFILLLYFGSDEINFCFCSDNDEGNLFQTLNINNNRKEKQVRLRGTVYVWEFHRYS